MHKGGYFMIVNQNHLENTLLQCYTLLKVWWRIFLLLVKSSGRTFVVHPCHRRHRQLIRRHAKTLRVMMPNIDVQQMYDRLI